MHREAAWQTFDFDSSSSRRLIHRIPTIERNHLYTQNSVVKGIECIRFAFICLQLTKYARKKRQSKQPFPLLLLIQSTEKEKKNWKKPNMWMEGFWIASGFMVECQSKW